MPTLPTGESWLCFGINGLAEARCTYLVSEKTGPKAQRTGLEIDWGKEVFLWILRSSNGESCSLPVFPAMGAGLLIFDKSIRSWRRR
jgi:hypothetical protein